MAQLKEKQDSLTAIEAKVLTNFTHIICSTNHLTAIRSLLLKCYSAINNA